MKQLSSFILILVALGAISFGLTTADTQMRGVLLASVPPGGETQGGMLDLNVTTWIQALNYLVFIFLMDKVLYSPILRHLDRRKSRIQESETKSEEAESKGRKIEQERQERLSKALREAQKERAEIKARSVGEYQEIITKARRQADARVEEARKDLEEEAQGAEEALLKEVPALADDVVSAILPGDSV